MLWNYFNNTMDLLEEGNGAPFSIICRTCLKAKQDMKSVYSSTIPDMLMYCVSLKVEHGDGLPNLICPQCLKQINQLFCFKQLCEKSESLLKKYLPLKIIPPQDLTLEDVTQNQILDTLEDPTLTSTSFITNESLVEPFDDQDLVETENLIPLAICLPSQYEDDNSLFSQVDLENEHNLYVVKDDDDFTNSYLDVTDNSWTDSIEMAIPQDNENMITSSGFAEDTPGHPCKKCKEVFIYNEDLSVHMSMHGTGFQCNVCSKTFHKKESLKRHIKRHMMDKPLCCHICEKRFSDKCDLKRHVKRHDISMEKSFVQIERNNTFKDMQGRSSFKPLTCHICSVTFYDKRLFKTHFSSHCNGMTYDCEDCGKLFSSSALLLEHSKKHKFNDLHKCEVCGKEFNQASNLQHHLNSHNPERSFPCQYCNDHAFKKMSSLKDHIAKIHPEAEEATMLRKCNICNLGFQKFNDLMAHKNLHKDLQYKCYVCDKAFPQKYRRKRHMLSHVKKGEIAEVNGNYILEMDKAQIDSGKEQNGESGGDGAIEPITNVIVHRNNNIQQTCNVVAKEETRQNNSFDELQNLNVTSRCANLGETDNSADSTRLETDGSKVNLENGSTMSNNEMITVKKPQQNGFSASSVSTTSQQLSVNGHHLYTGNTTFSRETKPVIIKHNPIVLLNDCINGSGLKQEAINPFVSGMRNINGSYECKICKTKLTSNKDLTIHMSLHPVNTTAWECNVCLKQFSKRTFLSRHIRIHMTREMYPCAHCDKKFCEKSKLRKHVIRCHPEVSDTPPASSEEEKSQTSLENSHTTADIPQAPNKPISLISSSFNQSRKLDLSQLNTLNASMVSQQITSPLPHSTDVSLMNDSQRKCNQRSDPLSCDTSNHTTSYSKYPQHQGVVENCQTAMDTSQDCVEIPQEQHSCDVCGKSYTKAIKLSLHMRTHNLNQEIETNFTCEVCKKTFTQMSMLTEHLQTHTNFNIVHSCEICKYSFNRSSDLTMHMKNVHNTPSKVVPLCKICGKTFTSMYKRRKHMQIHKANSTSLESAVQ